MEQIAESKERTLRPGGSWLSRALVLVLLLTAASARAQTPHLVKDINQFGGPSGMFASELVAIGDTVFFIAIQPATGAELWRTNGTPEGTVLVKDIRPGPEGSHPYRPIAVGGTLFFTADDGAGRDLWKSDGTATGTILVKDFGLQGTDMYHQAALDGILYFATAGPFGSTTGVELWRSDGTEAGTMLVKDIVLGATSSNPSNLTVSGGLLFFTAAFPQELWKSDGTPSGTTKVANLVADSPGQPSLFVDMDGTLFFRGAAGGLWRSDGTEVGTVLVWNGGVVSEGARMSALDGTLYFAACDGTACALWKSDGTTAGTVRVKDVSVNYDHQGKSPFAVLNGRLYFPGCEALHGCELWRSDGTEAGTFMVREINTISPIRGPSALTVAGGRLFFSVDNGVDGEELWKSDGTAAGTVMVKDIWSGGGGSAPTALVDANGALFFRAQDAWSSGPVWKSDGSESGTVAVKRIHDGREPSGPKWLTDVNGTLYFSADDGSNGYELWRSDGTAAGTLMVRDIQSGVGGSYPNALTGVNGTLFFTAQSGIQGFLWKSDGSEAGTLPVKEFFAAGSLTAVADTLYFAAAPAVTEDNPGTELWRSDGTSAGTVMVKDINPGSPGGQPRLLTNVNDTIFFVADDGTHGKELWKSDGTEAGTMLVKDIAPATVDSEPDALVDIAGVLFFTADDGVHGRELWRSDGTAAGTFMVKDIEPGPAGSGPLGLTGFGGEVFFSAQDSTHGREIWNSDGTDTGTVLLKDIVPGVGGSFPNGFTEAAGTLFFTLGVDGRLWRTGGGEVNTIPVGEWSAAHLGPDLGGYLYFVGGDPTTGSELWRSDGTGAGTTLVKDIYQGPTPSEPAYLTKSSNRLFFVATDGYLGRELWSLNALAPAVEGLLVNPDERTAFASATISSDGGSPITERGFLYSTTNPTPEIGGVGVARVPVAGITGAMATILSNLSPGTPYFIRAYAMTTEGVGYDEALFVTDALTGPSLAIGDVTVAEGEAGQSLAVFAITLSAPSAETVAVRVVTSDISAIAGSDYLPFGPVTVLFDPGVTSKTVAVAVLGDNVPEGPETFKISLGLPLNAILSDATAVGTIVNDDGPSVRVTDATVLEGDSGVAMAVFTVMLSTPTNRVTTVDFATSDRTASAPTDYASSSGTLTFAPGAVSLRVQVPVFGDVEVEADESFALLLGRSNGIRIVDGEGTGWIGADDGQRFAISDRSVKERGSGSRTIRLLVTLSPSGTSPVTVAYTTADGTAEAPADYEMSSGVLAFAPGETQKQIAVTVRGDADVEIDETFHILLSSATGGAIIADASGQVLIRDDDGTARRSRLLFHNTLTNRLFRWHMRNGTELESFDWVTPWATDVGWSVGAVADFDGDGQIDLLWHNQNDGRLLLWFLEGDALKGFQFLPYSMLPPWTVAATFDSDGSGRPDVIYQNEATGAIRVVQQDRATVIAMYDLAYTVDLPWRVAAGADVVQDPGDFDEELLIQNATTGQLLWWNVLGPTTTSWGFYSETQPASPEYRLVSANTDFNGDNRADLLWHNREPTGAFLVWFMSSTARVGTGTFAPFSATDPAWRVVGSSNIR